ncbi:MAG: hypothetical protein AAFR37_17940, partial [Cyanobacteria bacterium J06628_3]
MQDENYSAYESNNPVKDALELISRRDSNGEVKQTLHKLQELLARTKADNENLNQKLDKEIRNRKLLEDKLSGSEAKLRGIVESIKDIILVVTIEDKKLSNVEILPTCGSDGDATTDQLINKTAELFFKETAENYLE